MVLIDHWPLFGLRVVTPRLELRYPDDAIVGQLADLTVQGVHDPTWMPFMVPWTDAPADDLGTNSAQHFWHNRAAWTKDQWHCTMAVLVDGEVLGVQDIGAKQFAVTRAFETGSWLGRDNQGKGIGKEMRAAVLHLGFVGLGAQLAITAAWHDNAASLGVTRSLGYQPNGRQVLVRRDKPDVMLWFQMERAAWEQQRRDDITIEGLDPCLPHFGIA